MRAYFKILILTLVMPGVMAAEMLDEFPESRGGDPAGIWDADSLEIDVYASPVLRAAVSDLNLVGFVDGQISLDGDAGSYRSEYLVDVDVSLTILGGPLGVTLVDTVSEAGVYMVADEQLLFTSSGRVDTLGFSVDADTLSLIQSVPLGEFSSLAMSIDPEGGPPLAVIRLYRVKDAALTADFDGDGSVGFSDFLAFAGQFGSQLQDVGFDARFDLNSDGSVGFTDFLVFVSQFGK
jgi:hypothetical protein